MVNLYPVIAAALDAPISVAIQRCLSGWPPVGMVRRCFPAAPEVAFVAELRQASQFVAALQAAYLSPRADRAGERLSADLARQVYGPTSAPPSPQVYRAKEDFYEIYEKATDRKEALELWDLWLATLEPELKRPFHELIRAVENWKPEVFAFFDHRGKTNAYTEAMNGLTRVVNRSGRGYSFDAIRAKVLYGGKKRATDSEYKTVKLAMKIKGLKPIKDFYGDSPKQHREKKIRGK